MQAIAAAFASDQKHYHVVLITHSAHQVYQLNLLTALWFKNFVEFSECLRALLAIFIIIVFIEYNFHILKRVIIYLFIFLGACAFRTWVLTWLEN